MDSTVYNDYINIYTLLKNFQSAFYAEDYYQILHLFLKELQKNIDLDSITFINTSRPTLSFTTASSLPLEFLTFIKNSNNNSEIIAKSFMHQYPYQLIFPTNTENHSNGYILFCKDNSDVWENEEKELIKFMNKLLGDIYTQKIMRGKKMFTELLNSINANIYVTDPETDNIIFMNDKMKAVYQLEDFTQQKCWQVFKKNSQQRCADCPIPILKEETNQCYLWEEHSSYNDHIYQNYDCMIEWWDGRHVHIQHSVDITDITQMKKDAMYDELTGIFNRRAGKSHMSRQIVKAKKEGKPIIVCLYDMNHLKETNDTFGHHVGDEMLKKVSVCISHTLSDSDIFFRLSGDEFIISFYDCTLQHVNAHMHSILEELKTIEKNEGLDYQLNFCYGLFEVLPQSALSLNEIIMSADEKMYIWKRKSHLKTAVLKTQHQSHSQQKFDYNKDLLYNALMKSTDDYIFICNMKTNTFKYTPAMAEEFAFPNEILTNAAVIFGDKIHPDDKPEFLNSNQQIADGRTDSHIVEYRALNKNNEWVWLRCHGHVEYDENDEPSLFAGFISNLGKKNYRDILTGLYNKFEFEKQIKEKNGPFAMIMLNINDFKSINNLYDRTFGDNILRIAGQNLQTLLHKEATVFKLDGDVFALLLQETSPKELVRLFNKIQNYAFAKHSYEGKNYSCSFTAGAVLAPKDGQTYLELTKNCEMSLQYGKLYARNKMTIFQYSFLEEQTQTLKLMNALKLDMMNQFHHFSLMYQPKVKATTQEIIGFEALCRWSHPLFPEVGPGTFIPLLETSGDILALGSWVFAQALIQLKKWLQFQPNIKISINVSYVQLVEEHFITFVKTCVTKHQVPYHSIIIELTETSIAKNYQFVIEIIHQLRTLGIQIAMDDFGKGYSSLSLLKEEPLDIIKIDQSFVRNIQEDLFNLAFMKFIIELCHQIHLKVVVEGVETREELLTINTFHPDYIQGYYTGKPMQSEDALLLIQQKIDNSDNFY